MSQMLPNYVYDESLFLDKIKEFIPNPSMQNNNEQPSMIPEEDAIEEFEITKVEQDRDGAENNEDDLSKIPSDNRNAQIE